jgi:hypothetical protein
MYECDKNQMPYCNVKCLESENFKKFGPFIEHGPCWINLTIFTFISENNRYSRGLYKIWNKIISFNMKKKGKSKTCQSKSEKKR